MIRPQPNHLILRALFTPCRRAALTTADDLALSKAISRQDRGGDDFGASALGGNLPAARRMQRVRGAQTIRRPCELAHISRDGCRASFGRPVISERIMEARTHVAHYAATMTRELCRMCRKVELDDLAYLLEVAAAEATKVKQRNGSDAVQLSVQSGHRWIAQNFSGRACCTCGSARTAASTCGGKSPSISISEMALPPGASRPTWKVAMLMPASPSVDENRPMKPGLSK